jgi:hypothetical protein
MYRQLRMYRFASVASMLVAAVLLTLLYRAVAIEEIIQLTQKSNLILGQIALNAVKRELVDYLSAVENTGPNEVDDQALPGPAASVIADVMQDATVARIKIYNRRGVVVFSTKPEQIGESRESNGGFEAAIKGKVASKLIYRGNINLSGATEDDNLMSTYIPVRQSSTGTVVGVFEIYSEVENLVLQNELAVFKILAGIGLIFTFLYVALLLVAERATRAIETQQHAVREQYATLQTFYGQLLKSEEMAKAEVVAGLQKGIAQTLNTIKILLRQCREQMGPAAENSAAGGSVFTLLRSSVQEIHSIATGLQKSAPDEFGTQPAVDLFCGEFEHLCPGNLIEQQILPQGHEVPGRQKIIMYRIIESAFKNIAQFADADQIQILLRRSSPSYEGAAPASSPDARGQNRANPDRPAGLAEVLGQMTPPGGTFSARCTETGGIMLRGSWTK